MKSWGRASLFFFVLSVHANVSHRLGDSCERYLQSHRERQWTEDQKVFADRFFNPLLEFSKNFAPNVSLESSVQNILAKDQRRILFILTGLFKLYEELPGWAEDPDFQEWRHQMRVLKRVLGHYKDAYENFHLALRHRKVVPYVVRKQLRMRLQETFKIVLAEIKKQGWGQTDARSPYFRMVLLLEGLPIPSFKEDRRYVISRYREQIAGILNTRWDFDDFEGGFHGCRKEIRWLTKYIRALRGKVRFVKDRADSFRALDVFLDQDSARGYRPLPVDPQVKKNIFINKKYYLALKLLEKNMGKFKEEARFRREIPEAFLKSGLVPHSEALEQMFRDEGFSQNPTGSATKIFKQFLKLRVLERLQEEIGEDSRS